MPYLLIVSLVWAVSFGLIKQYLAGVDSAVVASVRVAFALLVFLPFLRPRVIGIATAVRLALIGALQFGVMYMAYIASYESLRAYQVAVLTIFTPFWVCLFDDLFAGRFTRRAYIAAAVAVGGTAVIMWTQRFGSASVLGIFLMQVSNACFALGQVLYRRWRAASGSSLRDRDVFGWLFAGAVLVTLPFAAPGASAALSGLTAVQWAVLAYLGVLASGVCFFLWNVGATKVSAATLAVMNNLKVPLAVACALLFFRESADPVRLLGGGALLAVALWIARERRAAA